MLCGEGLGNSGKRHVADTKRWRFSQNLSRPLVMFGAAVEHRKHAHAAQPSTIHSILQDALRSAADGDQ
eukprot:3280473-Amphidinium_carterae.1